MTWLGEPKTHALCHAMSAAASGPSARAYTAASSCKLPGAKSSNPTVARLIHCELAPRMIQPVGVHYTTLGDEFDTSHMLSSARVGREHCLLSHNCARRL